MSFQIGCLFKKTLVIERNPVSTSFGFMTRAETEMAVNTRGCLSQVI